MKTTDRWAWLDIAKAVSISLIVLGHTSSPLTAYVYLFHVPIFFIFTGLSSHWLKYSTCQLISKRFKRLIVPFYLFNFAFILWHLGLKKLGWDWLFYTAAERSGFAFVTAVNLLLTMTATESIGGATWFLFVLFFAQILVYALLKHTRMQQRWDERVLWMVGLLAAASWLYARQWRLSYNLDLALVAAFWLFLGYFGKPVWLRIPRLRSRQLLFLVLAAGLTIVGFKHYRYFGLDFPSRTFGPWHYQVITSLAGAAGVIGLSVWLSRLVVAKRLLQYVGQNSLWILVGHFLAFKWLHLLMYWLGYLPLTAVQQLVPAAGNGYWPVATLVGIVLPLMAAWLWQRFFPKLVSQHWLSVWRRPWFEWLSLGLLVIAGNAWLLSGKHFFYADDYGYLYLLPSKAWSEFFSFWPQQMYNDRPVGQLIYKLGLQLFDYRAVFFHAAILLVHVMNAGLVYSLWLRLNRWWKLGLPRYVFWSAALWFGLWPKSNMAVQWAAAMYDWFGLTLVLLFFHLILNAVQKRSWWFVLSYLAMLLAWRTKENTLLIPWLLYWLGKPSSSKSQPHWPIGYLMAGLISLGYLGRLIYLALSSNFMGYTSNSPYAVSLSPIIWLRNLARYVYLYWDVTDMSQLFGQSHRSIGLAVLALVLLLIISLLSGGARRAVMFGWSGFVILLLPVLPLLNSQHKLYLYMPGAFMALAVMVAGYQLYSKLIRPDARIWLAGVIAGLLYLNWAYPPVVVERQWWLSVGQRNQQQFQQLQATDIPAAVKRLKVGNASSITNIYYFQSGDAARAVKHRPDLEVELFDQKLPTSTNSAEMVINLP